MIRYEIPLWVASGSIIDIRLKKNCSVAIGSKDRPRDRIWLPSYKLPEVLDFHNDLVRLEAASKGRNADMLAQYFGEDPARCPFEQVVSTLLNFTRMFERAHEENCKQLELERKKAQKDAEYEKLRHAIHKKGPEHLMQSPNVSGHTR
ncbi:hypothetical protein B296_00053988 [Ensete ventricosum]|uniref:FH2 domain-containing protein n=1 Tax=Ensete ventricosum TaxID=4639 RepID=A0A426XLJ5_ENSVE|nr:hypothetical protein B296_00053988 [Ensete ventricosum]